MAANQEADRRWRRGIEAVGAACFELMPALFHAGTPKPLAIGIYESLVQLLAGECWRRCESVDICRCLVETISRSG